MRIHHRSLAAFLPAMLLAGCSSTSQVTPNTEVGGAKDPGKSSDAAAKKDSLKRDLILAQEKLAKAKRDLQDEQEMGPSAPEKARRELELAKLRLQVFDETEMPIRLAKSRLELQEATDSLDEAKEELEQLELMYKEQDLADKTREIVIRRSQRRLARTDAHLKLQAEDLKVLEERTLPQDRAKLELDLLDKQRAADTATRSAVSALHDKRIAVLAAESEVARLQREIETAASTAMAAK